MRALPLLTTCLLTLTAASSAHAYVRTQTCDPSGRDRPCGAGQQPQNVYWADPCITYYVHRSGSADFSPGGDISPEVKQAVLDSFEAWNAPGCSGINMQFGKLTCNTTAGRKESQKVSDKQHVVIWRDDVWILDSATLAVTLVNARPLTGEILDADIEINGVDWTWKNLEVETDELGVADIRNVLTHEVGHFIGLDHEEQITDATMFTRAPDGEVKKRDLHQDDITGLCTMYPFTGGTCSKRYVVDDTCTEVYESETGCSQAALAPARLPGTPWAPLIPLALCAGAGMLGRRRLIS